MTTLDRTAAFGGTVALPTASPPPVVQSRRGALRGGSRPSRLAGAALVASLALVLVAACSAPAASSPASPPASPTVTAVVSMPPIATSSAPASPTASAGASTSPPTQTDTSWGRIWDALPPAFPVYPGAEPAAAASGPASAVLTTTATVSAVVTWSLAALQGAGFQASAGPALEDGSRTIDATGQAAGCKAQVQVAPQGSQTMLTVLYGAACPFS